MGLPEIVDAVAVKVRGISGLVGASGVGVTAGVDAMPAELPATPYAMCYLGESTTSQSRVTFTDDEVEVRLYVPASSIPPGAAYLTSFSDAVEAAWRTGRSLGGLCVDSWYAGRGRIEREEWNGVVYLTVTCRIGIQRVVTGGVTS